MKIAHIVSPRTTYPLKVHNGRYEWALRLALAQANAGHEVTVYCAKGSGDGMPQISWRSSKYSPEDRVQSQIDLIKTALQDDHDVYHSHLDFAHYLVADSTDKPIIFTQHWFPSQKIADAAKLNKHNVVLAVPVTNFMAEANHHLGIKSTDVIYHGIDLEKFGYSSKKRSDRFVFVGRIAPHKEVHRTVAIAKAAGIGLDIIGKINPKDMEYWHGIEPLVDGQQIKYLGAKNQQEVAEAFTNAKGFIFASEHLEAFGQVIVEAQACGTPVIVSDVGANGELVNNEVSGFLATTDESFIEAINKIDQIDSHKCRVQAERFDVSKMLKQYDELYERIGS